MSICQCKVDAKGSIAPGSPASPAEVDNMHPSGRVDAGRIGRSVFDIKNGVFSEFQLTLMTARFDGLESIIGWFVCSDPLLSRAQSSCLDAHTSFETNTAAANVYKGNGPTKILMLVKGRVQYHVTQFKIPGGVLNILDLTSIITSKGAMVLCARIALMTSPIIVMK
ncbi:hypothetical protein B0H14DRAFT_2598567 [Mycena olivaceomarginata]|nr:hypothetical protein B0H14DRAFT_2598567 [Mycena olivaceomarginata]